MSQGGPIRQPYSYSIPSPHGLFKTSSAEFCRLEPNQQYPWFRSQDNQNYAHFAQFEWLRYCRTLRPNWTRFQCTWDIQLILCTKILHHWSCGKRNFQLWKYWNFKCISGKLWKLCRNSKCTKMYKEWILISHTFSTKIKRKIIIFV